MSQKKSHLIVVYLSLHLLWQSQHSFNTDVPSSADLTCLEIEKTLLLQHLKQVYNEFSRASCDFSSCLIKHFIFSLAESKRGCSKIGSIFLSTLWINRSQPKGQAKTDFFVDFVLNKNGRRRKKE